MDRNNILELIYHKQWDNLISVFKDNSKYKLILEDSILKDIIDKYFIDELINCNQEENTTYKYFLNNIYILHLSAKHTFSLNDSDFEKLIIKLIEIETNDEVRYRYAKYFPNNIKCKTVIENYQNLLPTIVEHSQQHKIIITENKNIANIDARISLFKSKQEYLFYKAIRECFQMHLVIPNVALNAIIDFDLISDVLSSKEKKYFWSALIDCVVIDYENNYKPINFFELDSIYHDNEKQKEKDKLKDSILSKAGQKLIRIRCISSEKDEPDFIKLIRDTILNKS